MNSFFNKKVGAGETLSEILIAERKKRELGLRALSQRIGVREEYLRALEQGRYRDLPGEIYAKNFLKAYLKELGLDEKRFLDLYREEKEARQKIGKSGLPAEGEPPRLVARVTGRRLIITPKIIRRTAVVVVIFVCLGYLGWEMKKIVSPPPLIIEAPADNLKISDYFVEVRGATEPEAKLTINGQEVLANREGRFSKRLDLQAGINVIEFRAVKKYGRPSVVYREVLVINNNE